MSLSTRIAIYLLAVLLFGLLNLYSEYQQAIREYEHDKSAMAAWGFLPLIFPIFFIGPFICVTMVAAVIELAIIVWKVIQNAQ